jgi:ubiquinone/menaquinone biosynthesis C-methylase UbiE
LWWLVLPFVIVGAVVFGSLRLRIPRDPGREKEMDSPAVSGAYDVVSRGLMFRLMRRVIMAELKKCSVRGIIVDIGCGPGYIIREISSAFPGQRIIGLDISPSMVQIAVANLSSTGNVELLQADAEKVPLRDGSVDFVISTGSLHHWRDCDAVLSEIYRILRPGGELLLLDLRRDIPRVIYYLVSFAQRFMMPDGVRESNGAVGSIWASYTPGEITGIAARIPFDKLIVRAEPVWISLRAQKK